MSRCYSLVRPTMRWTLASVFGAALLFLALPMVLRAELDKDDVEKAPDIETSEDSSDDPRGDSHDDLHEKIRGDGEKNLKEILRLMDEIENQLAGKKTGSATQKKQRKAIKKINELIEQLSKGCSKCSSSSSSSGNPQKKPGSSGEPQKKNTKQTARNEKMENMKPEQQKKKEQSGKKEQQSEKEKYGRNRNDQVRDGKMPPNKIGKLYQKLLAGDRWGELPPKMRDILRNSQAKEFPPRYRQLLYKYYEKMGNVSRESDGR